MSKETKKIKVLYILPGLFLGGMESFCIHLFESFDKNIYEFHFGLTNDNSHDYYEDQVVEQGGFVHKCDKDKYKNKFKRVKRTKQFINKLCKQYNIDVAHVNACSPLSYFYCKECKKAGVKTVILHSHASDTDTEKFLSKLFRKQCVKWSDYHFACGENAGEWMFGKKFANLPGSYIINNGFDVAKFAYNLNNRNRIRKELGIQDDDFVIGMVSRLHPIKNHQFILSIMPELLSLNNHLKLVIVGDGDMRQEIEKTIAELKLNDKVILTGKRSDIPELLSSFDCYVMPSIKEGLPTSAIEAQANGLPCVISDGIDHHCDVTGLVKFVSLEDKTKWIDAISSIQECQSSDRSTYNKKVVNAKYDIQDVVNFIARIYTNN